MLLSPRTLTPTLRSSACLFLVITTSCRQPSDLEEKTAQKTVWRDRFEVFLEHRLVVAGRPTTFVTHVTDLSTLEPRRTGPLRFILGRGGEPPAEHVDPQPARPGIYTPSLIFPKPGEWTITLHIPADGSETVVPLGHFTVYGSEEEARKAPEPEAPEGISFLKEQQWKVRTRSEPVQKRRMVERLRVPGRATARPGSRAAVTAPLGGRLLPPPGRGLPPLGSRVEAGQTLALVQPPFSDFLVRFVEAEAEVLRTKLALDLAELVYSRVQKLADQQFKSVREREEADFAVRKAKANYASALALQGAYQKAGGLFLKPGEEPGGKPELPALALMAPIAGLVTQVAATVGEHISPDRTIFSILDPEWLYIEARITEAEAEKLDSPLGAVYELPHAPGEFHPLLAEGTGRVVFLGPEVDPETRTVSLVYEVKNPGGRLRVGQALNIYLETARSEETLSVPESALVEEEGRPVAFVQLSGETFEKRHLDLGIRDSGFVEVRAGLEEGERVVTKEAYAVRLASVSTAIPVHGHSH